MSSKPKCLIARMPVHNELRSTLEQAGELAIVIFPWSGDGFEQVKYTAEIEVGVMTACVMPGNLAKPAAISNMLHKINSKLGGIAQCLVDRSVTRMFLAEQPTLLIGIDVIHPAPQDRDRDAPSASAVVGSMDSLPSRFWARAEKQPTRRDETVALLRPAHEMINAFFANNKKTLPARIFVFRDGVSDGQFKTVFRAEYADIREAARQAGGVSYSPAITYVVAQKRNHARFVPVNAADREGRGKNIPAGTLVDTEVVHPTAFDFFLCSHLGLMGTSMPTHYHVLCDESNLSRVQMANFINELCYVDGRSSGAQSIPAPVRYADLMCTRMKQYIKNKPNEQIVVHAKLERKMFFV